MKQYLKIMRVGSGAYDPAVLQSYWQVAAARLAAQGLATMPDFESRTVAYLLSPENMRAGASFYDMNEVKRILQQRFETGKDGQVVKLRFMPPASGKFVSSYDEDICNLSGTSQKYVSVPYRINKHFRSGTLTIDGADLRCIQEGRDEFAQANFSRFLADVISQFNQTILLEILSKNGSGKYNYIGNFASLNGVSPQLPGKDLPLYIANGYEPNFFGENILEEDMMQVGANTSRLRYFGSRYYINYMNRKGFTRPTSDTGIDWAQLTTLNQGAFGYDPGLNAGNLFGLNDPMLVLEPGALQLVTRHRYTDEALLGRPVYDDGRLRKERFVDPYYNLTWDMTTNIQPCDGDIKVHVFVEIYYGLIGFPDECYVNYPRLQGVKGVYLYDGKCLDTSACTLQRYIRPIGDYSANYDDTCTNNEVCTTPPLNCSASLSAFQTAANALRVTASFAGGLGQTGLPVAYTWTLNGAPVVNNSNTLTLAAGTWDEGDVVTVSVAQGTCTANASLTVSPSNCSTLVVDIAGTDYASGATAALGNVAAGTTRVLTLENAGAWDLYASSVTSNNPDLVVTIGTPANIASGQTLVGQIELNGAAGPHTAKLIFVSNDCNNPNNYEVNVTWTVV